MNDKHPEYEMTEAIYTKGRMDEKQAIAIRLYCMGTNIGDIARIVNESPAMINQWISNHKEAEANPDHTECQDTYMSIPDMEIEKDMMDTLLTEDVLEKLSYIIEAQKIKRKKLQAEGISKAKEKGIRFGRQPVPLPDNFPEIYRRYKRRELTVSEAADLCNMARTTFYDKVTQYEKSRLTSL